MNFFNYFIENINQVMTLLLEHIQMTTIAIFIAIIIGVPLGILINYYSKSSKVVLGIANIIQAIPSMALLGFLIPLTGIGIIPAIIAVILYSLLPIIKNTFTGLKSINSLTLEAAKGIGLTRFQILYKVQLPLALPIIMSGIRVAAVTAVGLMTMAAYIGAGGLGDLVFSGIKTMNTNQILAGAIPACLLALFVDFVLSLIEKTVTPKNVNRMSIKRRRVLNICSISALILLLALAITPVFQSGFKKPEGITVGGKDFTEQDILVELVVITLEENTDIPIYRSSDLAGSQIMLEAIKNNDVDIYIEYAGTAYTAILKHEPVNDVDLVYDTIKKEFKEQYNFEVLEPYSFNNTYSLAVTKKTAEEYKLETISDLKRVVSNFVIGTTFEFQNRGDGLSGLVETYNLNFKETVAIDSAPRYQAITQNNVQVIDAFTTDGLLKKYDLKVLKDDKSFFPPYYAIPVLNERVYNKYPEIVPLITNLGKNLTEEVMIDLNYKVDVLEENPHNVALNFLKENKII